MRAHAHIAFAGACLCTVNILFDAPEITPANVALTVAGAVLPDLDNPKAIIPSAFRHLMETLFKWSPDISRFVQHRATTHSVAFSALLFLGIYAVAPSWLAAFACGWASHIWADVHSGPGCRVLGHVWLVGSTKIPGGSKQETMLSVGSLAPILFFAFVVQPAGGARHFSLNAVGTPRAMAEFAQLAPDHEVVITVSQPLLRIGLTPITGYFAERISSATDFPIGTPNVMPEGSVPTGEFRFVAHIDDKRFLVRDRNNVPHTFGEDGTILAVGHMSARKGRKLQTHQERLVVERTTLARLVERLAVLERDGVRHVLNGELVLDRELAVTHSKEGFSALSVSGKKLVARFSELADCRELLALTSNAMALVESGTLLVTIRVPESNPGLLADIVGALRSPAVPTARPVEIVPVEFEVMTRNLDAIAIRDGAYVNNGQVLVRTVLLDEERRKVEGELRFVAETKTRLDEEIAGVERTCTKELRILEAQRDDIAKQWAQLKSLAEAGEERDGGNEDERDGGKQEKTREQLLKMRAKAILNQTDFAAKLRVVEQKKLEAEARAGDRRKELTETLLGVVQRQEELKLAIERLERQSVAVAPANGKVEGLRVEVRGDRVRVSFFLVVSDVGEK